MDFMSAVPSNKPYLIRALHQWCVDHGFTPYIAVFVTEEVQVPMDYVKDNEIVLNISPDACQQLSLDNDIHVPMTHVMAIYAKENGQGMSFPVEKTTSPEPTADKNTPISKGRPSLKLVK